MVSVHHKELEYELEKLKYKKLEVMQPRFKKLIFDGICIPLNKYVLTFFTCTVQ